MFNNIYKNSLTFVETYLKETKMSLEEVLSMDDIYINNIEKDIFRVIGSKRGAKIQIIRFGKKNPPQEGDLELAERFIEHFKVLRELNKIKSILNKGKL